MASPEPLQPLRRPSSGKVARVQKRYVFRKHEQEEVWYGRTGLCCWPIAEASPSRRQLSTRAETLSSLNGHRHTRTGALEQDLRITVAHAAIRAGLPQRKTGPDLHRSWSGWPDLNRRPLRPGRSAL